LGELNDMVVALTPVVAAFQRIGIPYYIGGSVASSYYGAVRSTMDVDVICEMREAHVVDFLQQFGNEFYISEIEVRQAVTRRSCFNLVHLPTSLKVDVFVSRQRPFDRECMLRAMPVSLGGGINSLNVPMAIVEDIIVAKLEWYRLTDETSERQWDDVNRLIRLLGDKVNFQQLQQSSASVGVVDLLLRLIGK
jgi:hypothetical protein